MTSCLLIRRIYFQIVTSLLSGSRDCLFELARISKIFGCLQRNASAAKDIWMFTTFILLSSSNKTCSIADKIMKLTELDPVSRQYWMTSMCWRLVSVSRWLVSESWSLRKTRLEWKTSVWCILADVQFYIGDLSLSLDGWCPKAGPWGKLGLSEKPQCDVFWLMSNSGPWLMTMESLQSLGRGWNSILCPCWCCCCRYLGKTPRISWRETRRTVWRWNHWRFYWRWWRLDSCNSCLSQWCRIHWSSTRGEHVGCRARCITPLVVKRSCWSNIMLRSCMSEVLWELVMTLGLWQSEHCDDVEFL